MSFYAKYAAGSIKGAKKLLKENTFGEVGVNGQPNSYGVPPEVASLVASQLDNLVILPGYGLVITVQGHFALPNSQIDTPSVGISFDRLQLAP